ncbi:MAG: hypothetical protein J6333_06025 [Planctomycetes bacterium]|nr:hypothetical protein [Planctomycetota bacterium]
MKTHSRQFLASLLAAAMGCGAAMAADTAYPDILNSTPTMSQKISSGQYQPGDEVPFVEGQSAPAAPQGWSWCLEKRPAVLETVKQRVQVREASWYYESVPPRYEMRSEQVMVEPEQKQAVLVSPARYVDKTEQRMMQPASVDYRTVPAEYATVTEEVVVAPERREQVFQQARYEEYTERVMVQPERVVREEVPGCDKDGSKIECYSTRTIPAEYATITKKRLVEPGRTSEKIIPAQKQTMQVRKVVRPARVEEVKIPAKYETFTTKVLAEPAKYRYETIPAKYRTVQKQVMVEPEGKRRVQIPAKYDDVTSVKVVKPERLVWVLKRSQQLACDVPAPAPEPIPAPRPAVRRSCSRNPFASNRSRVETVETITKNGR